MKHIVAGLLLVACGSDLEPADEIGSLEQPLTAFIDDGFGGEATADGLRCTAAGGWAATCVIPTVKLQRWSFPTNCLGITQDGVNVNASVRNGLQRAKAYLDSLAHGSGITITEAANSTYKLSCNNAEQSGTKLGAFVSGPLIDCANVAPGTLCAQSNGTVTIFPSEFLETFEWAGFTVTQRSTWIGNDVFHEVLHANGLGHNQLGGGAGSTMMAQNPDPQLMKLSNIAPTSQEQGFLQHFNPGGTSPHP